LAYKHGVRHKLDDTIVKQRWRVDEVSIPWR
jgi:hypothetical protein